MSPHISARRAWAYGLISRSTRPAPQYGSPEWLALPEGPEKVAAVVVAAEAWAREADELAERLRLELETTREALWKAHKAAEDAEFAARGEQHARDWLPNVPGFRASELIAEEIDREWREWASGGDAA